MMLPSSDAHAHKLRIQFRKGLRRGYVNNAVLDPVVSERVTSVAEPAESFIVRIDRRKGGHYWLSDRRVLHADENVVYELLRYSSVSNVHWMFKDLSGPAGLARMSQAPDLKREHYDRLEIETQEGIRVMDGLGHAYVPVLSFFQWITPR